MSIQLSNRTFPLLEIFAETDYMTIEEAQKFDQRPFRALLRHEWVVYAPKRGFHITREGHDAWRGFNSTEILRKNPKLPLTAYFDPTAYGLPTPQVKVHVMRKRA